LKRTKPCFVADVDTGAVAGTFTSWREPTSAHN
jgi:hypothetical protein